MGKENAKKRNKKKNATIVIVNIEIEVQERGRDFSLFVLLKNFNICKYFETQHGYCM